MDGRGIECTGNRTPVSLDYLFEIIDMTYA